MLTTSKEANSNYLAKVVVLKGLRKHSNADRLQTVDIDFQTVITWLDAKEGDVYVYFPVESKISKEFLSETNSFRDKTLNKDPEKAGFFEENCRVKAMKLLGEKSMGYIVPMDIVYAWAFNEEVGSVFMDDDYVNKYINQEFDTINGKKLVEKYQVKQKTGSQTKQGKKPKISRFVDGQVHLHSYTKNLRRNVDKIAPHDTISISYKTHGTSWWVSNVLVKRNLTVIEKSLKWLGFSVQEMEYDLVYGSRRVVKNANMDDPKQKDHFFGYDLWEKIKDEVGDKIPKGYTLYGEMLGYNHNGGMIQKGYDYGCKVGEHRLEVYRITQTNPDGLVTELSFPEIEEFCNRAGLNTPKLFFYGEALEWYRRNVISDVNTSYPEHWQKGFIWDLEREYNEKDCFMCTNKVPEEGVVIRKESLFNFEAYKLKSFRFLEWESLELDKGVSDVESEN